MAITLSIDAKGIRGGHPSHHSVTAAEIRHVKLSGDQVGLNIDPERGSGRAGLRMTIEEARILADMLIQGADMAERRLAAQQATEDAPTPAR